MLEPTKLNRLIDIIHERLADHQYTTTHDSFEVFLTGNRREEMTNVDDVLALDNSPKHKIQRLLIVCSASTTGAAKPEHEVHVDFGSPKSATIDGGSKKKVVAISVRSDIVGWASRTLSELEEQVERTWLHYTQPVLTLLGILLFLLLVFSMQLAAMRPQGQVGTGTMWLQGSDLDRVEALVRDQRTITDQELREVVTRQLRNVLEAERPQKSAAKSGIRQQLFVLIPAFVILSCIFILFSTCYPMAVFLWGDEVDRYSDTVQRRKLVWNLIFGILFVGLLSKFFYEGVIPWFPN